jgi:hypothetical protein
MGASESVPLHQVPTELTDDGATAGFACEKTDVANDLAAAASAALGIDPQAAATAAAAATGVDGQQQVLGTSLSDYQLESTVLGEGGFGKVRLATNRINGHQVAVKIIKRAKLKDRAELLLEREVKHHQTLRHANIVRLHTTIRTPSRYYLVMEVCPRGDLLAYLHEVGTLSDASARAFFTMLIRGINFCHSLGVHHRDLKVDLRPTLPLTTHIHAILPASLPLPSTKSPPNI